jgi:hypothetical protein
MDETICISFIEMNVNYYQDDIQDVHEDKSMT